MPRPVRLFHLLVFSFQKSLTRVYLAFAKELPSLRPPTLSGMPFELRMDGLPKIGCLRILAGEDGSDLLNPGLALSQASTMFFHIDLLRRFSLGAARSAFRSEMEGPLPWRESLVWPTLCQTNSFHGSPPGLTLLPRVSLARPPIGTWGR